MAAPPPERVHHRGVNRTRRRGIIPASEPRWTEEEATVLIASCPRVTQNYNADQPWVVEIADLLGRSPSSVSMHLGNVTHLFKPEEGLPKVGRVFARVWDRYKGDEAGLQLAARRLRQAWFDRLPSPRLEKQLTEAEAAEAETQLLERFAEARLPSDAIILYRYTGSIWAGVLATIQYALQNPRQTAEALRIAGGILGDGLRRNPAANDALDEHTVELAERDLVELAPHLDYHDLDPPDRVALALLLPRLKSLKKWRARSTRLELFEDSGLDAARNRIQEHFHINPTRLCRKCVHMLTDVLEDAVATGKL